MKAKPGIRILLFLQTTNYNNIQFQLQKYRHARHLNVVLTLFIYLDAEFKLRKLFGGLTLIKRGYIKCQPCFCHLKRILILYSDERSRV